MKIDGLKNTLRSQERAQLIDAMNEINAEHDIFYTCRACDEPYASSDARLDEEFCSSLCSAEYNLAEAEQLFAERAGMDQYHGVSRED